MTPGLYCLSGNFTINGGTLSGDEVTIYITSGDFDSSGNATINLSASTTDPAPYRAITGMLIYLADGNDGEVSLLGDSDSSYMGTVYAADEDSTIEVGGTGSLLDSFQTQLVGGTVFIHGNVDIEIDYEGLVPYKPPTQLELYK
jgi:hypothetical protein